MSIDVVSSLNLPPAHLRVLVSEWLAQPAKLPESYVQKLKRKRLTPVCISQHRALRSKAMSDEATYERMLRLNDILHIGEGTITSES